MKFEKLADKIKQKGLSSEFYVPEGVCASDAELNELYADSRRVRAGSIFACVKGEHSDGHDYAEKAVKNGAAALMCERRLPLEVPQIICEDVRRNMGLAASCLYGHPAENLKMFAVTGTTGKTTSTFITKSILENIGVKCGLLGTVFYQDGKISEDADRTTPEADFIQLWLRHMVENGCGACVMETSSHSIVQGRLEGTTYDRGGFTNLSVDHLDYHKDMESYFLAKKTLFQKYMRGDWRACVNIDDEHGRRLYGELGGRSLSYSLKDQKADYYARILSSDVRGMEVEFCCHGCAAPIVTRIPVIGSHNVMNALQAVSLVSSMGFENNAVVSALASMEQVPGRLERYMIPGSGTCVIDFAHAPDGLEKVLTAVKMICRGRLIVIFGAGGDRDRSKRPMMGEIASRLADYVIITSDNPRSEEPSAITAEIEPGAKRHPSTECVTIVDRREAIYHGLSAAGPDDMVVIAGKGPERYQILKTGKIPFLDRDVMLDWCREHGREVK